MTRDALPRTKRLVRPDESGLVVRARGPRNRRVAPSTGGPEAGGVRVRTARRGLVDRWRRAGAGARGMAARLRRPGLVLLRAGGILLAVAGAVALGRLLEHHLTTSPAFAIQGIAITGLVRIERGELLEAAGIDVGTNVFAQSPEDVEARLLRHPWISSVSVSRRLPGQFAIALREREPVALLVLEPCDAVVDAVCEESSSLYLVSDEGTLFKRLEGKDPVDLPVISGIERAHFGTELDFRRTILMRAVALLQAMGDAGLTKRLSVGELHVEAGGGISLYVGDRLTHVRLGLPPFEEKLRRMKKVFDRLEREHAEAASIYLDNEKRPDRVTVRLR